MNVLVVTCVLRLFCSNYHDRTSRFGCKIMLYADKGQTSYDIYVLYILWK